jgi:hypothetical protein
MSDIDREWETGEWPTSSEQYHHQDRANDRNDQRSSSPAKQATMRKAARSAPGKIPPAQAKAIADINARYKSDLNDELPTDL